MKNTAQRALKVYINILIYFRLFTNEHAFLFLKIYIILNISFYFRAVYKNKDYVVFNIDNVK